MPNYRRLRYAVIDTAASGDTTIVSADAKNKIKVVNYTIVAAAAVAARWKSGSTAISGAMPMAANGGAAPSAGSEMQYLFETAISQDLVLNLGAAVQVSGHLAYVLDPQ